MKTPLGIRNRDFLLERKLIRTKDLTLIHFKSVTDSVVESLLGKIPNGKVIRSHTIISGYIIERYEDGPDSYGTKLTIVSNNEFGGTIPKSIVDIVAGGRAPYNWSKNLY